MYKKARLEDIDDLISIGTIPLYDCFYDNTLILA